MKIKTLLTSDDIAIYLKHNFAVRKRGKLDLDHYFNQNLIYPLFSTATFFPLIKALKNLDKLNSNTCEVSQGRFLVAR